MIKHLEAKREKPDVMVVGVVRNVPTAEEEVKKIEENLVVAVDSEEQSERKQQST